MWPIADIVSNVDQNSIYLIISLLISHPICITFNTCFTNRSKTTKLLYHLFFGFSLIYFNFGFDLLHSLFVCLLCYSTLRLLDPKTALIINSGLPLTYLLYGCYVNQIGSNYSIGWTLPQCVLTLRLIAITFDIYDGQHNQRLRKNKDNYKEQELEALVVNKDSAIESMPSLLEFLSHCYFPATILVGPLVPYRKYIDYIESNGNHLTNCWTMSLIRLILGVLYLLVYKIGSDYWPNDYLMSEEFSKSGLWYKLTTAAIVTKVCMNKYLATWLMSEAACIASGVAWDGQTHYSCANIHIVKYETTPTLGGIIKSFNLTTNHFSAKYIFKRLKFMGNKSLSQALTLLFLAVWHGLSSGYFATFLMEFLLMKVEMDVIDRVNRFRRINPFVDRLMNTLIVKTIIYILFRFYTIYLLGYSFVPFMLLQYSSWLPVWAEMYFYGHIITISYIFIIYFIDKSFK